jgi:hypothetical protein
VTAAGARSTVVWAGRGGRDVPAGIDGWTTSPDQLATLLEDARELVVADPLSFPWRHLRGEARAVPLTVTLPATMPTDDLVAVLDRPLLRHLTSFDRVVADRPGLRERLGTTYHLVEDVWSPAADPEGRATGKARLYEAVEVVRDAVRPFVKAQQVRPLLGYLGRARDLAGPVSGKFNCEDARYEIAPLGPADEPPSPHALVVRLDDGGQGADERRALLARARDLLHPGGLLVLLASVVTVPGGAENPSVSTLVEELAEAFGGMVHVDDLRAVRWRGETMSRAVVLSATALGGGRI